MRDGFVRSEEGDARSYAVLWRRLAMLLLRIFTNLIECCRYTRKTPASARHLRRS